MSSLNDNDDNGYAAKLNLVNSFLLKEKNKLRLISSLDYEYVQQKFQPLERLRDVEFTRDWGLPLVAQRATENIVKAATGLRADNGNSIQYAFTNYNRSDDYNGFQNALTQFTNWRKWSLNNQFVLTNYKTSTYDGYFLKPIVDISKKISWMDNWIIGGRYTLEENVNRNTVNDSLNFTSFLFF
ncbi:hypothetical protein KRR40_05940 [Niabella defluvii]|nr:hypothetical protein KRR40_05940 [Niabella sp. I65]